jgi:hypothetical protein
VPQRRRDGWAAGAAATNHTTATATVYGLFGPGGFLGVYLSADAAMLAGDFWAERHNLQGAQSWRPDKASPASWQRELAEKNRDRTPAGVLRVRPLPLNDSPRADW